jgi:aspartate aminotransferase
MTSPLSLRLGAMRKAISPFVEFFTDVAWGDRLGTESGCDFLAGNPQELALPGYVEAIRAASEPLDPSWFAYKSSERVARDAVAASLRERLGTAFRSTDVLMTKGASTALILVLRTVVTPGDEVIFVSPPWFFYEAMIHSTGGVPVRVRVTPETYDLDVDGIAAAITPKTRAVIVNSPHNPTGRIYPPATTQRLASVLEAASRANRQPIYLLSDEAYNRIVFDGRQFVSPTAAYPNSFLIYSYGKTLLTPGQRLGYVALPPTMPDRDIVREALFTYQLTDYGWPDSVLQYALPQLEQLSIDIDCLQRKRDWMVESLRAQGYAVHVPDGTFYLLPRAPVADDDAFTSLLASQRVYALPGRLVEMPGYFRLSLTATEEMIERALPIFARAIEQAEAATPAR